MSSTNYRSFMHATSQILQMIETAKSCVDDMIDDLSAGFVVIDGEGRILRANHAVAALLGVWKLRSVRCLGVTGQLASFSGVSHLWKSGAPMVRPFFRCSGVTFQNFGVLKHGSPRFFRRCRWGSFR